MTLSDVSVRNFPPPTAGQITVWDASFKHGLFGCRVSPGGAKTFLLKHRNRRITIGRYPTITLAAARTEAKRLLAEFTLGRIRPQSITYKEAVRLFLEEKTKGRKASTVDAYKGLLNRLAFNGQLSEITGDEVRRKLSRRPNYNHYLVALKVFFTWCIKRRYVEHDPVLGLSKEATQSRARVLTDDEIKSIWRACEQSGTEDLITSPRLPANFATIVKLLILTGQRRNEIASLQSSWITTHQSSPSLSSGEHPSSSEFPCTSSASSDLWQITLPASITKNGREHTFPIGMASSGLLLELVFANSTPAKNSYLFPARGKPDKPFNGWSKSKAALDKLSGVTGWTLHDLRRLFASTHAKIGTPIHITERLLNHISGSLGGMVGVYQRHTFMPEMTTAMHNYQAYITKVIG